MPWRYPLRSIIFRIRGDPANRAGTRIVRRVVGKWDKIAARNRARLCATRTFAAISSALAAGERTAPGVLTGWQHDHGRARLHAIIGMDEASFGHANGA